MHDLTDTKIRAAIREGKARTLSDGGRRGAGSLVLRIRPTGAEWYLKQWVAGRPALAKLGRYPDTSLAEARRRYVETAAAAQPGETARQALDRIAVERAGLATLRDLAGAYVQNLAGRRSEREARRVLIDGPDAAVRHLPAGPANEIAPGDVAAWLARWIERDRLVAGNAARAILRACFAWGLRHDFDPRRYIGGAPPARFALTSNPVAATSTLGPRPAGRRWLDAAELVELFRWCATGAGRTDPRALIALRLVALSGQRVEQVLKLTDAHLDRRPGWACWDAAEMKTGRAHAIPVEGPVGDLLSTVPRSLSGLMFPSWKRPADPYPVASLAWVVRRCCADTGLDRFTARDLRRSWRIHAGEAGLSSDHAAAIMARPVGASRVDSMHYAVGDHDRLKREAVEVMARYFAGLGICGGGAE